MKTIRTLVEDTQEWRKLAPGTILRVNDKAAKKFVDNGEAEYVPKSTWKQFLRGDELKESGVIGKAGDLGMEFANPLKNKSNKMSKAMKRHMRRAKHGN